MAGARDTSTLVAMELFNSDFTLIGAALAGLALTALAILQDLTPSRFASAHAATVLPTVPVPVESLRGRAT